MDEPRTNRHDAPREEFSSMNVDEVAYQRPIIQFATKLKLPESTRGRKRKDRETEPPRPKSEEELREEAARKQVEETGKPVVLDGTLLLPEGMALSKAILFLPDGFREHTEAAWDAKLGEVWGVIFKSTKEQIRKNAEEKGDLERWNSFPLYVKNALTESILRGQWGFLEVPLEELIAK